jgi:hypothetical protein
VGQQVVDGHCPTGGDEITGPVLEPPQPLVVGRPRIRWRSLVLGENLQQHEPRGGIVAAEVERPAMHRDSLGTAAGHDQRPGIGLEDLEVLVGREFVGPAGGAEGEGQVTPGHGVVGENAPGERVEGQGVGGVIPQNPLPDRSSRIRATGLGERREVVVDEFDVFRGGGLRLGGRRLRLGHGGKSAHAPREQQRGDATLEGSDGHAGASLGVGQRQSRQLPIRVSMIAEAPIASSFSITPWTSPRFTMARTAHHD